MKIAQDVLTVLSTLTCEGSRVRIEQQLDRKLYVAVDKVLQACGGKWNRSAKAHVFSDDAAPLIDAIIVAGEVTTARDIGYFPTPPDVAQDLINWICVNNRSHVFEPSAGDGRLVDACLNAGAATVTCIERDAARRRGLIDRYAGRVVKVLDLDDCLDYEPIHHFSHVAMNPPFTTVGLGNHLDHVLAAFTALARGGVLGAIMPSGITFREDKRHVSFRAWLAQHGGEIEDLPENAFKSSGTGVRTVRIRMWK